MASYIYLREGRSVSFEKNIVRDSGFPYIMKNLIASHSEPQISYWDCICNDDPPGECRQIHSCRIPRNGNRAQ